VLSLRAVFDIGQFWSCTLQILG